MINFEETELRLGLPGGGSKSDVETSRNNSGKRGFSETVDLKLNLSSIAVGSTGEESTMEKAKEKIVKPPAKAQVVGWPPVRSSRKNIMAVQKTTVADEAEKRQGGGNSGVAFVKVSMDGAPYLRKVDLKLYGSYQELSDALGKMFSSFTSGIYGSEGMKDSTNEGKLIDILNGSEFVPTFEDKDGDWMLVGDVPWEMFVDSCKRMRIMKGSETIGLGAEAPRAVEKCKNKN